MVPVEFGYPGHIHQIFHLTCHHKVNRPGRKLVCMWSIGRCLNCRNRPLLNHIHWFRHLMFSHNKHSTAGSWDFFILLFLWKIHNSNSGSFGVPQLTLNNMSVALLAAMNRALREGRSKCIFTTDIPNMRANLLTVVCIKWTKDWTQYWTLVQ